MTLRALCFPHSSVGKESTCNAGDPHSTPGSGRSPGEGTGYPLQYSQISLVAQLVKNRLQMWETWVQFLGWGDLLEKGKATQFSILAWRFPWTIQSRVSQRVGHNWVTFTFRTLWFCINDNKHLNKNYASTSKSLIKNYFNNSICCCSLTESCLTVTPWTVAHQASLPFTVSWSLLKLRSIE